jgi:hypothetical protein
MNDEERLNEPLSELFQIYFKLDRAYPKRSGEHEVHPYLKPEKLCRGSVNILYSPLLPVRLFSGVFG